MAQDIEMLAGEYVLGTLSAAERLAFERDLASRQDLRRAVAEWEKRLAPLNGAGKDVAPPRALWTALEAALPQVAGRPELKLIQGSGGPDKLRAAVAYWKRATLVASALAAMLAVAIVGREIARAPADSYVAVVNRGGDQPALIVRVDVASGTVLFLSVELLTMSCLKRSTRRVTPAPDDPPHPLSTTRANAAVTVLRAMVTFPFLDIRADASILCALPATPRPHRISTF